MPTSFSIWDHSIETLEQALDLRKQIEALKKSVAQIIGGVSEDISEFVKGGKRDGRKGKRSPEARARMAAAQKARWAAKKSGASVTETAPRKKRKMSPEARAKIAAAQRARWAKSRA